MKIYDISMLVHPDMPVYKNRADKRPVLAVTGDYSTGHSFASQIKMDMHTGTHVDAPLHMLEGGGTVDGLDLSRLVTRCKVLDLTAAEQMITRETLAPRDIRSGDFLLLKTGNSLVDAFDFGFVYLEKSGAGYLRERGVKGVGIDALGIERDQPGHDTHKILFRAGIVILEGLRLKDIQEGEYLLCAAPVKVKGAEAAPARAVLIDLFD